LAKAIWNRGTEVRLKRSLAKAKRGEGFTVGVVGGSGRSPYSNSSFTTSATHLSVEGHLLMGIHHYPPHGGDTSVPTSRWASRWEYTNNSIRRTRSPLQQHWKMVRTRNTSKHESSYIQSSRFPISSSGRSGDWGSRWEWEEWVC
jgi:hypothetical protein